MDLLAVGGDVFEEMCKRNSGGEEKARRGNKRPVMDLGERMGIKARSNLPELPNTMFMVVIHQVSKGNDMVLSPNQLPASYTDVRHWEEVIDFIDINGGPKEPYIVISMFKCTVEQDELDNEYMG